ncbi:MAG: cyclic nucleotide-binding domain-containing protein, partial [Microcystis panniformis Mp_MB_F_20051200_S6D]
MEEKRYPAEKSAEIQKLLDTATLLVGLPPETLDRVTAHAVTRTHPANRAILLEQDWGGSVYFILDGWVKIRTYNVEGKEVTLNILGKGEIVGEMAALEDSPRST